MRFYHYCSVAVISAFLLAACDSGTSDDTPAAPSIATPAMSDLLSPDAGIYRLRHGSAYARNRLEYLAYTSDASAAWNVDPSTRSIASSEASYLQEFWVLNNDTGKWESRAWREESAALRRTEAGAYTQEQWTGALAEISVDHVEDLSNQPLAQHVPVLALLQSGVTLRNEAVFAPGSQRVILRGKVLSDTYTLVQEAYYAQTTLAAWMQAASVGQGRIDDSYPVLEGVTAAAESGPFVTAEGKTGTWQRLNIRGMDMVVLLGGTADNQLFHVNLHGAHPLLAMHNGKLMEGMFIPAGADAWRADLLASLAGHKQMDFNKTALDSIVSNLLPGTFFGFGTPAAAATLLDEGINDMHAYLDNYFIAFTDRLRLQEGRLLSQRFLLDFDIPAFSHEVAYPAPDYLVLNHDGDWGVPAGRPAASVNGDGTLVQSDGSWLGGTSKTTFRSLDLGGHVISDYEPLVDDYALTALEEGYFLFEEPHRKFGAGAKLISRQVEQQTPAYHLLTGKGPAGFATLSSLVNNTSVYTSAAGDMRLLVFPEQTEAASSGVVNVLGWGSIPYGMATWEIKRVGNTDILVINTTPGVVQHRGGDDKINIMFSVHDGQVYAGVEILPGHVDITPGLILNRQALQEFEKGAVRF